MAALTTTKSSTWSDATAWSGGAVPVAGTDTVTIQSGHTITVNGTYGVGTDTSTPAITIASGGILKASRTATNNLTLRGDISISSGGELDYGKSGDPTSLTYKSTLTLNYSASLAVGEYGIRRLSGGKLYMYGATIDNYTTSTAICNSGQANITVASHTNWEVGATIVVSSSNVKAEAETKIIQSISGDVITCTTNFTYSHASGVKINYHGGSTVVTSYNSAYPGFISIASGTESTADLVEIQYTSFFNGTGHNSTVNSYGLGLVNAAGSVKAIKSVSNNNFYGGTYQLDNYNLSYDIPMTGNVFSNATTASIYMRSGTASTLGYFQIINSPTAINSAFNQGGQKVILNNGYFNSCTYPLLFSTSILFEINDTDFDANTYNFYVAANGSTTFNNCKFNMGVGTPSSTYFIYLPSANAQALITLNDCETNFGSMTLANFAANLTTFGLSTFYIRFNNREANPQNQEFYSPTYLLYRDNSTYKNSQSAIRLEPKTTSAVSSTFKFLAANGVPATIKGSLRYNTAYGTATKPSITISGLGITPSTYTMTGSANTWEDFTLTVTQNSGADGELDVVFTGQSTDTTSSQCWLSGIPVVPYVTFCRHYGYVFQPTIPTRTVDPITVLSESAANAITGYSIDDGTDTLTITGTVDVRDLYDAIKANRVTNLTTEDFFTTTDGINFASTYDIYCNGGTITGTGTLNLGSKTFSTASGGGTTLRVTDVSGTQASITLTGLETGSLVQLYNLDTSTEMYVGTSSSSSLSYSIYHSVDINVRIRVMYCNGTDAKIWWEDTRTFTVNGLTVAVTQVDDTTYISNNIDGSTITNVTINDGTFRVNINTGSITWKQLYAYETYWLSTTSGIRDEARFCYAPDTANYIWTAFRIKNVTSPEVPLTITGGWGRDSVTQLTQTLIDTTGGDVFSNPDQVIAYATGSGLSAEQDAKLTAISTDTPAIKSNTDLIPALL